MIMMVIIMTVFMDMDHRFMKMFMSVGSKVHHKYTSYKNYERSNSY